MTLHHFYLFVLNNAVHESRYPAYCFIVVTLTAHSPHIVYKERPPCLFPWIGLLYRGQRTFERDKTFIISKYLLIFGGQFA